MTGPQLPGVLALEVARQHLGVKEHPPGSNRTPFGAWIGVDGAPWCAAFVSYCFHRGAGVVLCADWDGPGVRPLGCVYVPTIAAWGRARGFWLPAGETPVPGDLAIYDWQGDGRSDHVGIVDVHSGGGHFLAIEGNTAEGNDSDGGQVMLRERHARSLAGLVRVR